jgi:polysaccharide biosynthesis protein PslJ
MIERHPMQSFFASATPGTRAVVIGLAVAAGASVIGLSLAVIGPVFTAAMIFALAGAIWTIWRLENALWAIIAVIALLPFATLPIKVVITPTFLDLAMGAALFLYFSQWMFRERRRLTTTPVHPLLILFIILSIFSFVAGLRYAGLTSTVIRKFAELVLSMAFALILVDILRTPEQIRRLTRLIMIAGTAAALVGIMLWVMPDQLAEIFLTRLAIIGYPDGGVIQYIEANPELSERAIGTSINPNSLGGLLVMIAALAAPQLITHYPVVAKRWLVLPMLAILMGCLVLTFSRGSMLAFAAALFFIALLRYRRILAVLAVLALILLILPWSQPYIERFSAGFQGEDLATQMRFGEYSDALTLVSRYPLLGVGFSGAPDIDIYLGVSSVYLLLAENMGLLGLSAFLLLMTAVFVYAFSARRKLDFLPELRPVWLGLLAGLVGALVNGVVDHYFFNLEFHHAIMIFWIFVGIALATTRIVLAAEAEPSTIKSDIT